jgi:hypothetical protein
VEVSGASLVSQITAAFTVLRSLQNTRHMSIQGHKPSGYFVTADGEGHRIEGETRQCCHCQYTWEYHPGLEGPKRPPRLGKDQMSEGQRGWCLKHGGFLCGRADCFEDQERMIALYALNTGKVVSCMSYEEWNDYLRTRPAISS